VLALRSAQQGTDASAGRGSRNPGSYESLLIVRGQCGAVRKTRIQLVLERIVGGETDYELPLTLRPEAAIHRRRLPRSKQGITRCGRFRWFRDRRSKTASANCTTNKLLGLSHRLTSGFSIR